MTKKITTLFLIFIGFSSFAQIVNEAPFILTIEQLKDWTETGATADTSLIASTALATRFSNAATQLNPALSQDLKIVYLPDGMNNFGNYSGEQDQFNLYNFVHWQYIDKIVWFGGTADQTVQLPSSPWTDAAHRNGVKVFGDIFFSPNQFGGSTATLQSFLEQNANGNFLVIPKLVAIMQYYNFDGWFINEETSTNSATGQLMYDFLKEFTAQVEAEGKEVMWYDSMLISGQVSYQNFLSGNNTVFFQNDEDGNDSNGFEQRVSSSIFINFFWNSTNFTSTSNSNAAAVGRSAFDVFTGVDLLPGRNQMAFETGGNNWMGLLHQNSTTPYTSLGLFATNVLFDNSQYSDFKNDASDFANLYSSERHLFGGADSNPETIDASGFKGISNWVPAASVITEIPFVTNFNTGHGQHRFIQGTQVSADPWHNMDEQSILPTWQFAFSENDNLNANWDFDQAYNGGSALKVFGNLPANDTIDLALYKTQLTVANDTKIDVTFEPSNAESQPTNLILSFANDPSTKTAFNLAPGTAGSWTTSTVDLSTYVGQTIASIGFRFFSDGTLTDYSVLIGKLQVYNGAPLGITLAPQPSQNVQINQDKDHLGIRFEKVPSGKTSAEIYNLQGKILQTQNLPATAETQFLPTSSLSAGIYLLKLKNSEINFTKKFIVQ